MYDLTKHFPDIITNLVSNVFWVVVLLVFNPLQVWLHKAKSKSKRIRAVSAFLAVISFGLSIWSAIQVHQRSGFTDGLLFAVYCFLSLLSACVLMYPFIKRFLPIGSKRLNWAEDRNLWTIEHSPETTADIIASPKGLHFRAQLKDKENRWAKMEIIFTEAQNYHAWAGISFDIRFDRPHPDTEVRLEVKVPTISNDLSIFIYRAEKSIPISNGRPILLFQEMWGPTSRVENPQGYLDLQKIISVAVVCNSTCDVVEFYVDNFALVKFTDIPS